MSTPRGPSSPSPRSTLPDPLRDLATGGPARTWASLRGVGLFTAAYLLAATWAAVAVGNVEFVFYLVVMGLLVAAVLAVHLRVGLSVGLLWGLSVWGALHMAGGLVPVPESWPIDGEIRVLYSWWIVPQGGGGGWLKYDQAVHAYGFGIATWLCWQGLVGALDRPGEGGVPRPSPGLMILVAVAGMGLGALNEVVEFIATRITVTNVGGYENTGWDLVYNALGASVAALTILVRGDRRAQD